MPLDITPPTATYLLLGFGCLALLVINLLIALVEGVFLTLLAWNPFRQSMTVSMMMNILSGLVNGILLVLLQRYPFTWIPISFVISLILEGVIMTYFKRDIPRKNFLNALLVNLASYILLILPAYYYGSRS